MGIFSISFRIEDKIVSGKSYTDRYDALIEVVRGLISGRYWEQTTSFVLIESDQTIGQICSACKGAIATSVDLVLIMDANVKAVRYCGNNGDADLEKILDYARSC